MNQTPKRLDISIFESVQNYEEVLKEWISEKRLLRPERLLLINPPIVPLDYFSLRTARNAAYFGYPPVGLLYIAAAARKVDPSLKIKVLDLNYFQLKSAFEESFNWHCWERLLDYELSGNPDEMIGITCMFGTTMENFRVVTKYIRKTFPESPVIAGGVQATYDYEDLLNEGLVDFVVRNEGESQIKNLLRSLSSPTRVSIPHGSAFKFKKQIVLLPRQPKSEKDQPINDWDYDLTEFYDQLPVEDFNKYGALGFSRYVGVHLKYATVLTRRGCRAQCTFCGVRDFNGKGVRLRSLDCVMSEIKYLVHKRGVQHIDFLDDDPLWDAESALSLFKRMYDEVPGLKWTSTNGIIAASFNEELMEWAVKSGMVAFKVGVESGNEKILRDIKKPTTKSKLRDRRDLFSRYPKVFVTGNFIIGFPGENFGQMLESYNFAKELEYDWCTWNVCQPLKGTEQWSMFQEIGDPRCKEESYQKTLNPGRSMQANNAEAKFRGEGIKVVTGMNIFEIDSDVVPSSFQLNEIWFSFNLISNFIENKNLSANGNPDKYGRWLETIHAGYPFDASMAAGLVKVNRLLGKDSEARFYRERFISICTESSYWRRRISEFPVILEFAECEHVSQFKFEGEASVSIERMYPSVTR